MAKEVSKFAKMTSYERGVEETEKRLADEQVEVYRDYYKKVWAEVLNQARVPATSEWRSTENIFYLENIREVPTMLPPPE